MIDCVQDYINQGYKKCLSQYSILKSTAQTSQIPILQTAIYGFEDQCRSHHINKFQELGWTDPFPCPLNILKGKFNNPTMNKHQFQIYQIQQKSLNKEIKLKDYRNATKEFVK